ncbi:hypothetical protein ACHAXA_001314 [Cyclostephanos tholiformis]|uniref:Uncharacterized protein n=1 Tax=Cyclostephanos tholiformis TaxID=382380 RepID=A0ABD3RG23_9STRA
MKLDSTIYLMAAMAATIRTVAASESDVPCLTADECDEKRKKMGITEGFYNSEDFQIKGCYFKNDKAFFSLGTEDEMTTTELPGILTRIWCDADAADSYELRSDEIGIEVKDSNDILLEGTDGFIPINSFIPDESSNSGADEGSNTGVAKSSRLVIATSFVGFAASLMC